MVGVRLCGDEFTDGGMVLEDAQEIARRFAGTGQVDYFSVNQLYGALKGRVAEVYAVGDCVAPRLALDAIHDGHEAAKTL